MAVFLVTWDLNNEKPNYSAARAAFVAHLDRYPSIMDRGLDSVRFISSSASAEQISGDLTSKLDSDDRIIVTKLAGGSYYGWLNKDVWDWIAARITA